jgi:hypothetical protein
MAFYTSSSQKMLIDSSGNVGINCTPSAKLDARLSGTSSGAVIQVGNAGSGGFGGLGVVAGALDVASGLGDSLLASFRVVIGAMFLGAITDAMLLGHWYLVQPGMPRKLLNDLVDVMYWALPLEVLALLLPTGMVSVINGSIDDGWNGTLGWFWVACAVTTAVLIEVTRAALKERSYSAVMAATGLLYLAILTAFGTDLVARAVLA